jgi:hypothetical protein
VYRLLADSSQWPWAEWSQDKQALLVKTGLSVQQVEWLYEQCREKLVARRHAVRHHNDSSPPLTPHNMLCITLHWLRRYPPFKDLAATFHRPLATVTETVKAVMEIMNAAVFYKLVYPITEESPHSTRSTLSHVMLIVDTTFVPLPKTPFQPKLYHKKSPTKAALKFQLGCDLSHRIVSVSSLYRGPTDDRRILRESDLLDLVSPASELIGDRGYTGDLPVITPSRRKRKRVTELAKLESEGELRHELESERAAIENINERVKEWKIVAGVYRGEYGDMHTLEHIVRVVSALTNLVLLEHPLRKVS